MSDLISRQAAIELAKDVSDAIMSGCNSHYDSENGDEVPIFRMKQWVEHLREPTKMMYRRYIVTITRKSDGSVVRVMKAIQYFVDACEEIPNITVFYEDRDGNYCAAFYPLLLYDFEILDI